MSVKKFKYFLVDFVEFCNFIFYKVCKILFRNSIKNLKILLKLRNYSNLISTGFISHALVFHAFEKEI